MWYQNSFFKYATGAILILLIISLLHNVSFLYVPVFEFIAILFIPVLVAGILYFVLRPLVNLVENYLFKTWHPRYARPLAILTVYLLIILFIVFFSAYIGPILVEQIGEVTSQPSDKLKLVKDKTLDVMNLLNISGYSIQDFKDIIATYLLKINAFISDNIVIAITTVTKFTVLLLITPFILYYFLKDDHILYATILHLIPIKYQKEARIILKDADETLSTFITGQLLVALIIGVMLLIGYSIIGLSYAITLAFFAMFFFTIPMLGSFIAIIPALLVGLSDSPWMAAKVVIVMLIVLFLEGNLISPQIMSQRLHLHPAVLILILLASGALYGVLGLFLATPLYALAKVIVRDLFRYYNGIEDRTA